MSVITIMLDQVFGNARLASWEICGAGQITNCELFSARLIWHLDVKVTATSLNVDTGGKKEMTRMTKPAVVF